MTPQFQLGGVKPIVKHRLNSFVKLFRKIIDEQSTFNSFTWILSTPQDLEAGYFIITDLICCSVITKELSIRMPWSGLGIKRYSLCFIIFKTNTKLIQKIWNQKSRYSRFSKSLSHMLHKSSSRSQVRLSLLTGFFKYL